ncbi:hypothetical protein M011DRAFT_282644 [Sporormia fimetaria CBS 119925]|uniref:Uncharacterized protein n=1 Tax=Sporormia fimetaria CBS 119925 TaxID=1340428 RepID=A0A6A6VK66_9PLEO|nr:hypothetical protein M011DRAFT_282644 [Sporormia fimetaria CBS 119925]
MHGSTEASATDNRRPRVAHQSGASSAGKYTPISAGRRVGSAEDPDDCSILEHITIPMTSVERVFIPLARAVGSHARSSLHCWPVASAASAFSADLAVLLDFHSNLAPCSYKDRCHYGTALVKCPRSETCSEHKRPPQLPGSLFPEEYLNGALSNRLRAVHASDLLQIDRTSLMQSAALPSSSLPLVSQDIIESR